MSLLREVEAVVGDVGLVDDGGQRQADGQRRVEEPHEGLHHHCEVIPRVVTTAFRLEKF